MNWLKTMHCLTVGDIVIDLIIVGLLLIIIFILLSVYAPEITIYTAFVICIVVLIICIVVLGAQFIHDPIGFLYNLIVTNPLSVFQSNMVNESMKMVNQTIIINQHP